MRIGDLKKKRIQRKEKTDFKIICSLNTNINILCVYESQFFCRKIKQF